MHIRISDDSDDSDHEEAAEVDHDEFLPVVGFEQSLAHLFKIAPHYQQLFASEFGKAETEKLIAVGRQSANRHASQIAEPVKELAGTKSAGWFLFGKMCIDGSFGQDFKKG